uniref:Uncharacterized protein n=1 Tax=Oryza rufipogon TaxID=4529 RepID=A0A0E0R4L5_ORYRU
MLVSNLPCSCNYGALTKNGNNSRQSSTDLGLALQAGRSRRINSIILSVLGYKMRVLSHKMLLANQSMQWITLVKAPNQIRPHEQKMTMYLASSICFFRKCTMPIPFSVTKCFFRPHKVWDCHD